MSPERVAGLVRRWVRWYTRGLPPGVAERRSAEIDADLHDHVDHERAAGASDARIARAVAARLARGLPADAAWRREIRSSTPEGASPMGRSVTRVALATALILLVPLVGTQVSSEMAWSVGDFAFAAVFLAGTGLLVELAMRHPQSLAVRAAALVVGVGALAFGESDDAPPLVLVGGLLIIASAVLTMRTLQRGR